MSTNQFSSADRVDVLDSEEQAGHIKKSEKAADNDRQAVWRDSSGSGDNFL